MAAAHVQLIQSTTGLEGIRPEWEALWRECPTATPFQAPGWLLPWWRHFGQGEPYCLALFAGDRLRGLAPFYIYEGEFGRQLFLIGIGSSDYQDVLVAPGFEVQLLDALREFLEMSAEKWDRFDLRQVRPGSVLLNLLNPDQLSPDESCPVLSLHSGWEQRLSRRFAEGMRYAERKAATYGQVSFELAEVSSLQAALDDLFRFYYSRWENSGWEGPLMECFLRESAAEMMIAGALRCYRLRIGDTVAAAYLGFVHQDRAYYYMSGFDPKYAHCSPGNLIVRHAIAEASRERAAEFDFLRGLESYKFRWGAIARPTHRGTAYARTELEAAA